MDNIAISIIKPRARFRVVNKQLTDTTSWLLHFKEYNFAGFICQYDGLQIVPLNPSAMQLYLKYKFNKP